ncbi:hypothetical protein JB92DRAFT_3093405 [Gautieria morchelliformis]|nr:hypothetical protein JB92DRAFT_3093405 [Gautieria morchelliformis]
MLSKLFVLFNVALAGLVMASPTATVCTTTLSRQSNRPCATICSDPPPLCTGTGSEPCCCIPVTVTVPC